MLKVGISAKLLSARESLSHKLADIRCLWQPCEKVPFHLSLKEFLPRFCYLTLMLSVSAFWLADFSGRPLTKRLSPNSEVLGVWSEGLQLSFLTWPVAGSAFCDRTLLFCNIVRWSIAPCQQCKTLLSDLMSPLWPFSESIFNCPLDKYPLDSIEAAFQTFFGNGLSLLRLRKLSKGLFRVLPCYGVCHLLFTHPMQRRSPMAKVVPNCQKVILVYIVSVFCFSWNIPGLLHVGEVWSEMWIEPSGRDGRCPIRQDADRQMRQARFWFPGLCSERTDSHGFTLLRQERMFSYYSGSNSQGYETLFRARSLPASLVFLCQK